MDNYTIKDIIIGKPDASDEALYSESLEEFCSRIILPPNFNIENILKGEKFYIVGNKGVGKTALLFYIKNQLEKEDPDSLCSMILFKRNISAVERAQMEKFQKELVNNLDIDQSELAYVRDFTPIWTLLIYSKIVKDNRESNYRIFECDTNWSAFEEFIKRLNDAKNNILQIVTTIPERADIKYNAEKGIYISKQRKKYPERQDDISLANFYDAIEYADKMFQSLTIKNHKYYICIDELEAYNNEQNIFLRDLTMIRDLIITTKRINELIRISNFKRMKIILSVRTEMLKSISNELAGLENNKGIDGFEERINWGRGGGYGIYHPLFAIWLKRIEKALYNSEEKMRLETIYQRWFPFVVGIDKPENYILDRTWYKPRDIIRFMDILSKISNKSDTAYSSHSIMASMIEYSARSKVELIEELGAVYSNNDINKIFMSLTAFKRKFTKEEYKEQVESIKGKEDIFKDVDAILDNLYRVGIIGCYNIKNKVERWSYLGAETPISGAGWEYMVHRGLWSELQLQQDVYDGIPVVEAIGETFNCTIMKIEKTRLSLRFEWNGQRCRGKMHIKNLTGKYIENKEDYIGKEIKAFIIDYNENWQAWEFSGIY